MLAIIILILMLNLQFGGLFQVYFFVLLSLPIIVFNARFGLKKGMLLSAAVFISSLLFGSFSIFFYVTGAIVIGTSYSYGLVKGKTTDWIMLITTLVNAISLLIETYVLAAILGYDLYTDVNLLLVELSKIEGLVLPSGIERIIISMIPLVLVFSSFLQALITHIIAMVILKRLKITARRMRPINEFKISKPIGFILLICLFVGNVLLIQDDIGLQTIGSFLTVIPQIAFISSAFIITIIYSNKVRKKFIPTLSLLALLFLPSVLIYVYIGLGLLDIFTDFRERIEVIKTSS